MHKSCLIPSGVRLYLSRLKIKPTRAGVYETLCPQHVLAHIDKVEHNVPYGKNA